MSVAISRHFSLAIDDILQYSPLLGTVGRTDATGRAHTARVFNAETAEQLNSWITRYEAQLRQITDVSLDLIHVLLLLYGKLVETQAYKKDHFYTNEFWEETLGDV